MVELVALVTSLALLQTFVFAFQVGQARVKYGVKAPETSGKDKFERIFRVHQNTVEQLVIFLPALWMFAYFVRADVAAGLGLIFIIGRQVYRSEYLNDPASRSPGFGIGAAVTSILILGSLIGALLDAL